MFSIRFFISILELISSDRTPKPAAVETVSQLIAYGVSSNKIKSDYVLFGHRQTWQTACPGNRLYNMIKSWPHWQE